MFVLLENTRVCTRSLTIIHENCVLVKDFIYTDRYRLYADSHGRVQIIHRYHTDLIKTSSETPRGDDGERLDIVAGSGSDIG